MGKKVLQNWPLLAFLLFILGPQLGRSGFVILLITIIIFLLIRYLSQAKNTSVFSFDKKKKEEVIDLDKLKNMNNFKGMVATVVLVLLGAWLFFASIVIVDAGEIGVYSLFGRVNENELKSGFHLVIPLAKVTKMSVRTEEYTMSIVQGEGKKFGSDVISALTKEGLNVDLDMTVLYRLQEDKASDVYETVGLNYDEKIIRPSIRTSIRDIIAQFEAKDIYSEKRQEAAMQIKDALAKSLEERGIIIEDVLLRNVVLPANLANSIQEKLQAEQEAEKYDFLLEKEKKEKERKIIEAEGQRDAQKIINESLSTNYLYYLYINDLKEREGTIYVPTNPSTGMPLFRDLGR